MCANGSALQGPGSLIYGTIGSVEEDKKSFWQLLLGLFVGPHEEGRNQVDKEFQEHMIVPRLGTETDRLTLWVVHSFIPLFHHIWKACIEPTWGKLENRLSLFEFLRYHRDTKKRDLNTSTIDTAVSDGSNFSNIGDKNITTYSKNWILCVTSILRTAATCLAIIILTRVPTMGMILGLIALFNTVFALMRIEIFTATA